MQIMRWLSVTMAVSVIIACFFTWVSYGGGRVLGGFYSSDDVWGRPGLLHVVFCSLFILSVVLGKIWSMKLAFFISALNIAWSLRNFLLLSACEAGICPDKQIPIYILVTGSFLMTLLLLFSTTNKRQS